MKRVIKLTESELVRLVNRIIKEQPFEPGDDDLENFEDDFEDDEVNDYGFDYDEPAYDDEMQSELRRKAAIKRFRSAPMELPSGRPGKEEKNYKPYNPIKSTDMDLDTYLKSIKRKKN